MPAGSGKSAPRRVLLGCWPTPLQELPRLSKLLGGGRRLFVKRDDLAGAAFGGNKVRKLEYLLGEALESGCDCVVTGGGPRSNQPLAAAACAARLGLEAHLVHAGCDESLSARLAGLFGAVDHFPEEGAGGSADLGRLVRQTAKALRAQGRKPYVIPPGAPGALGALGYADCMRETAAQAEGLGIRIGHVLCCGATGGTYAGIVLGTKLYCPGAKAVCCAIARRFSHRATLLKTARQAAEAAGLTADLSEDDFTVHFSCGRGAAHQTGAGRAALLCMAREEGILLDPYYTGKAFAGLLELNEQGAFAPGECIVFVHTGGASALLNSLF